MAIPKDLSDGIFGASVAMHGRDIHAAHAAVQKYLGKDTVAEQASEEFKSLPASEQQYYKATGLGRFGAYTLMTTFEVEAALKIVAREMCPSQTIDDSLRRSLQDSAHAARVTERFPVITPERIAAIIG